MQLFLTKLNVIIFKCKTDSTREEFDELVTKSIFNPNRFGARFIPAVTDLAKQMHEKDIIENDKKDEYIKKTPSMKIRIIAALMDIATEMNAPAVSNKIASEKLAILSELAKQVRMSMLSNRVIDTSNWTNLESNYKLYYCLILEDLANERDKVHLLLNVKFLPRLCQYFFFRYYMIKN